jgi:hypothetical protein
LGDFRHFSANNLAFFLKTGVMILYYFLPKYLAVIDVKSAIFPAKIYLRIVTFIERVGFDALLRRYSD